MAQEVFVIAEVMAHWKQVCLAIGGFCVRLLWFWERPIKWTRVISGLLFLLGGLYLVTEYVTGDYQSVASALLGLFTNNIIAGLFRWWGVNEDALMDRTNRWWKSDQK
jgi:hypothetical protein